MAELLLRVVDKVGATIYQDCKLTKRGDVIVVQPNGWAWSVQEKTNPAWRILGLPNVSESAASVLLSAEKDVDPLQPSRVLQRRKWRVAIANLATPIQTWIADATRAVPMRTTNISEAQFQGIIEQKPALVDPAIIGLSPSVIG